MKKMLQLLVLVNMVLGLNVTAHAGFLFEPYVGYETGKLKQTGTTDIKFKGANYGARLGYDIAGFRFGLDYMTAKEKGDQAGNDGDYNPTDMGAFIGYQFPFAFKFYASYFFSSKAEVDPEFNPKDFSGDGSRVGISFTGFPVVNIGVEMITRTYKEYDDVKLPAELKGTSTGLVVGFEF